MSRKLKAVVSCVMVLTMLLSLTAPVTMNSVPGSVTAEASGEESFLSYDAEPDGFRTATDPYGYGIGRPFSYITQNETFYYSCKNASQYCAAYGSMTGTQFDFDSSTSITHLLNTRDKLNFTQVTAFDGDGSGRDSYVAIVGVDSSSNAKVHILDCASNRFVTTVSIGKMGNYTDDTQFYQASNHLSITAGDFDGDGKDSLVIYATITQDLNGTTDSGKYGLFQVNMTYDGSGKVNGASLLNTAGNQTMLNHFYRGESVDNTLRSDYEADERNKLCVSMAVGDVNNDKIDDLVVLSYCGHFSKQKENTDYRSSIPYLSVGFGKSGRSTIIDVRSLWYTVASGNSGSYDTMKSPGVAVADFNGENGDEIVVAGESMTVSTGGGGKYWSDSNEETIRIARYGYDSSTGELIRNYLQNAESENTMTKNTIYDSDNVFGQIKVAGVYMNGRGNAAYAFINGDIYDLSNVNTISKLYTYDQINTRPGGISVQMIYSYAVGNFEHNSTGAQQICFILAEKESGEDDYDMYYAVVGRKNDGTFYGTTDLRSSNATRISDGKGDNLDECLSGLVAAIDCDSDGIVARYRGVEYYYSDPDVIAVLQAGPYFDDIGDYYSNNNETSYKIKETQTYEEAVSDNVSMSVCATVNIEAAVVSASISAGYAMDWTKTFANSVSYTVEETFTAQGEDTVVVYRKPVFVYSYDVQDTSGNWKDSELCMTVEKKPVFTTMSVDDYNDFCDAYNNQDSVKKYNADKKAEGNSACIYTMTKLDKEKLKLGTEGNPFGYHRYNNLPENTKIFGDLMQPGTSDSATSIAYIIEKSESTTTEIAHGLHFGSSIAAGSMAVKVGIETSLDYLHGKSSTTSLGYGTEFDCNIQNPKKSEMLENGYTEAQVKAYTFNWYLASWNSNVPAAKGGYVPVIGYALGGVSALPHPPTDVYAVAKDTDEDGLKNVIDVSWEPSATDDGYPAVSKYNVYIVDENGEHTLIKSNLAGTEFTYTITDDRKTTVFAVRGVLNSGLETLECIYECDSENDPISIQSIEKVGSEGLVDKYKITYTGTKAPSYFYVTNGADGQTAYEAACENGYKGTKEQWLEIIGADCQINGHKYSEHTLPATCGVEGFKLKVCTVCGNAETETLNALKHEYDDIKIDPTCYSAGYTIHKCLNCGDYFIDGFVKASGHKYTVTEIKPDCINAGYSTYECQRCGEKHIDDIIPASGHKYKVTETKPDCVNPGYTTYTCEKCGEKHIDDIVSAEGHKYEKVVTDPTCSKKGYTTYTCKVCGEHYISDMTDTVGHTFTDEVIKNTCTETGYTIHYCKDCGYQEIIDRTEVKAHDWKVTEVIAPTCTEKGYSILTCSECGVNTKTNETECIEHTPGEWFCDDYAIGHYIRRCENCYCKLDEKTVVIEINVPQTEDGDKISQGDVYNMQYGKTVSLTTEGDEGTFSYSSSDPDVVVVNENGEVEAVGAGTAIITVIDEDTGISTSFSVKITKPWWQKVHELLVSFVPFKVLFMLFGIRY